MCGISGIIHKNGLPVDQADIKNITDIIAHRGPDGEGFYFGENFALGHRRLAIIDLSLLGMQPMHYMDRYVITFNGEIYNYIELKEELTAVGYIFKTHTDTEVILAAYDKWGTGCFNKFNGMWALALFDKKEQSICLSRDRFGVKPLYYYHSTELFVFGSEIKQLLPSTHGPTANIPRVIDFIISGASDHTEETFFTGILKVPQSHFMMYSLKDHSVSITAYYELQEDPGSSMLSKDEAIVSVSAELLRSITYRLRSDVTVGTCLSGGLDSSLIAATASPLYSPLSGKPFTAVTAKSMEKNTDESQFAEIVVKKYGLSWHVSEPSFDAMKDDLTDLIATQEEPFGGLSVAMQYFVMKSASEADITVLLDGQGGDEVFLGYDSYISYIIVDMIKKWQFLKAVHFYKKCKTFKISGLSLIRFVLYQAFPLVHYFRLLILYPFRKKLFSYHQFRALYPRYASLFAFQKDQIMRAILPQLLRFEDKNSMRWSIETRLPFLDYKLVEMVSSLPLDMKVHDGFLKYIERIIAADRLPDEIAWRKVKYGFFAPESLWINAMRSAMIADIHNSAIISKIFSCINLNSTKNDLLWKLYSLAVWEKKFLEKGI